MPAGESRLFCFKGFLLILTSFFIFEPLALMRRQRVQFSGDINANTVSPSAIRKFAIFADMNEVERNIQSIMNLCVNHGVDKLYLFGSAVTGGFNEKSDVDFVVRFKHIELLKYSDNYFDLKFSLEDLLNRPVDLLEEQSIKNPYFLASLNETKKLIYG